MQLRIWGVRGSLPTPLSAGQLRDKMRRLLASATPADLADATAIDAYLDRSPEPLTYGGNTACVELRLADQTLILDAGSGIRGLSEQLFADGRARNGRLRLLFTHFHWDHLCGLPFFGPIYLPGRELDMYSWRAAEDIDRLLGIQMADGHFPVKWPQLPSRISCHQLAVEGTTQLGEAAVRCLQMVHPDGAYGYRIDAGGRAICYLTDTEVSKNPSAYAEAYAAFVDGADVVIVDAMYGFLEYHEHYDFGHSSIFTWIDFFKNCRIGELVMFHHDPQTEDHALGKLVDSARRYLELVAPEAPWRLSAAAEGQTWDLPTTSVAD